MNGQTAVVAHIEDYALLSDCRSAALVSKAGSIDWLCFPRFDSPACFARLLGGEENGHWTMAPAHPARTVRAYRSRTLVLETVHHTERGVVAVIDAMVPVGDTHRLIRIVEGRRGTVEMRSELRIRFDYGSVVPWVRRVDGALQAVGGPDGLVLRTPVELHPHGYATVAQFMVGQGDRIAFDLAWFAPHQPAPPAADVDDLLEASGAWWGEWSAKLTYDGAYRSEVHDSLTVLKGMWHSSTGAFVAAPTTSLPEWIGGTRNWDYRFCWLRDATFTLLALIKAGYVEEATAWRDWLLRAVAGDPSKAQIMYGVAGERRLPELELPWLAGFDGSAAGARRQRRERPAAARRVRRGHGRHARGPSAWHGLRRGRRGTCSGDAARLAGATTGRSPTRASGRCAADGAHFTYSKVMAWVAFDRAVTESSSSA